MGANNLLVCWQISIPVKYLPIYLIKSVRPNPSIRLGYMSHICGFHGLVRATSLYFVDVDCLLAQNLKHYDTNHFQIFICRQFLFFSRLYFHETMHHHVDVIKSKHFPRYWPFVQNHPMWNYFYATKKVHFYWIIMGMDWQSNMNTKYTIGRQPRVKNSELSRSDEVSHTTTQHIWYKYLIG